MANITFNIFYNCMNTLYLNDEKDIMIIRNELLHDYYNDNKLRTISKIRSSIQNSSTLKHTFTSKVTPQVHDILLNSNIFYFPFNSVSNKEVFSYNHVRHGDLMFDSVLYCDDPLCLEIPLHIEYVFEYVFEDHKELNKIKLSKPNFYDFLMKFGFVT